MSIDNIDKSEEKEMKKIRPVKNTWYDWLINYISEPIIKIVVGFRDKIVSLFNTDTPKQTVYGRGMKLKQSEETKIIALEILLYLKRKKEKKRNYR